MRDLDVNVLAVDPGVTTGFVWQTAEATPVIGQAAQLPFLETARVWLAGSDKQPVIVCEDYFITAQTLRKTRQTASLKIIGALEWLAHLYGASMFMQRPADAKRVITDERLKAAGLWIPGRDHANDASRHLLLWLVAHKYVDLAELTDGAS